MPKSFRSKDLMINVMPPLAGSNFGSASMPGPDADPDDFTRTFSPIINVAAMSPKFQVFADLGLKRLSPEAVKALKEEVGNAVLAGLYYCTVDMPTCRDDVWGFLSPTATIDLSRVKIAYAKERLKGFIADIDKLEESWFHEAQAESDVLVPALEDVIAGLQEG